MAWSDEIQKTDSILGDIGEVVEKGLGIFTNVRDTMFPASSMTQPESQQAPATAKPEAQPALPLKTIAVVAVIGYMIFAARK